MITYNDVKTEMANNIASAMYMELDEVAENRLFSSYGLESITLVKIVARMSEKFGVTLDMKDILPHQTLSDSSNVIYEKIQGVQA